MSATQPTFSVIVPTSGRPTLAGALSSVAPQLLPGDEIIVVCNADRDLGTRARNSAMSRANATHLLFLDDDDEFVPGAFEKMRRFAFENPGRIGIFREELVEGSLLWTEPIFRKGNVGSPMFVVPNVAEKLAPWVGDEGNDWYFIEGTAELQGDPIFVDEVVARLRPHGIFATPLDRLRFRLRLRSKLRKAVAQR